MVGETNEPGQSDRFAEQRARMVEEQVRRRGVVDDAVLAAMATVPRERFVPEAMVHSAYEDGPLPITRGQTISQPYIVALMAEALRLDRHARVLEIGTGSGYGAAVLSRIAAEVVTIERHQLLAERARAVLAELHYDNVTVIHGDGSLGLAARGPYDGIVVTAGAPTVPESLLEQLTDGGSLVIPVGDEPRSQTLFRVTRRGDRFEQDDLGGVRFVPLIGDQGWSRGPVRRRGISRS
jgi:protein-L-isoaspartate(D-aspartate) O-methyltransferase